MVSLYTMTTPSPGRVDRLDAALIELLAAEPRVGALEASRRLRVARGTVQARLERLQDRGVITGYGPDVDPAALGYEVTAFVTLEIRQAGGHDPVAERLTEIPEVLEVHTITGAGDMLCRVVARSNADLQRVIDAIVSTEGVVRSVTLISLATQVPYRVLPLVRAASRRRSRCEESPTRSTDSTGPRNLIPSCEPSRMGGDTRTRGVLSSAAGMPKSVEWGGDETLARPDNHLDAGCWARGMWRADRACPDPHSDRNTHLGANVHAGASAVRQVNVGAERSTRPLLLPEDYQYQRLQHLRR